MDGAEAAHFLHHLLAFDLTGFNVRKAPGTAALADQKILGADSLTRYWHECLQAVDIVGGWVPNTHRDADGFPTKIAKSVFCKAYREHAREHGERYPMHPVQVSKRLAELSAGTKFELARLRLDDPPVDAVRLADPYGVGPGGGGAAPGDEPPRPAATEGPKADNPKADNRKPVFVFDTIAEHRAAFLRAMRTDPAHHPWEDDDGGQAPEPVEPTEPGNGA